MWRHCRLASALGAQTEAEGEEVLVWVEVLWFPRGESQGRESIVSLSHLVGVEPEHREHRSPGKKTVLPGY